MKKFVWILLALLVSVASLPCVLAAEPVKQLNQDAVNSIFMDGVPVPYQLEKSGWIEEENRRAGFYVVLRNQETQSQVLLLDLREPATQFTYLKSDFLTLSRQLWMTYTGFKPAWIDTYAVKPTTNLHQMAGLKLQLSSPEREESGFIGRLQYSNERYVIILMRNAAYSATNFDSEFTALRQEANELLVSVRSTERLMPSERIILWRLRQIFKPDSGR